MTAWIGDLSGASHPLDAPSARARALTNAWLARRGWCRDDNDRANVQLDRPRVERGITFDIDRETHLLDRTEERLNEDTLIEHFDDWRLVAGAALPFVVRDEYPQDQDSETYLLHEATPRDEPSASAFAEPPQPNDVAMLNGASMSRVPYLFEAQKPIVEAFVNGVGPFPFVLDTGAHFILTPQTARRVGLVWHGSAISTGQGNGLMKTGVARIRSLRIGNAVIVGDVARIVPYSLRCLERGRRPPKAGWLGLSLFERSEVTIDPVSRGLRPPVRAFRSPSTRTHPSLDAVSAPVPDPA